VGAYGFRWSEGIRCLVDVNVWVAPILTGVLPCTTGIGKGLHTKVWGGVAFWRACRDIRGTHARPFTFSMLKEVVHERPTLTLCKHADYPFWDSYTKVHTTKSCRGWLAHVSLLSILLALSYKAKVKTSRS
jgi:hypothetical protein